MITLKEFIVEKDDGWQFRKEDWVCISCEICGEHYCSYETLLIDLWRDMKKHKCQPSYNSTTAP